MTLLFRFAVMADTHVNPDDGVSNSPWASNRDANARTRHVVRRINAERPDLVMHVGDMVHPVPEVPTYADAARRFWGIVDELKAPLHVVPGNHDVGDKPVEWSPADPVTGDYLDRYRESFGRHFYSFDTHGCHFVVINTMVINSGLDIEPAQREWLEEDLAEHAGQRIFVFGHYPIFLAVSNEPECYDNIAEPGRSWLLRLFDQYTVEAYTAGHVHNFFFNRHGDTDCYLLPSTSFVRHDYSELSHVAPGPEWGRDEVDKLGYLVVDVHDDGHDVRVVRTCGRTDESVAPPEFAPAGVRRREASPLGLDMRHPWAETVELPYNGLLDEFSRRTIRNDYPLLAMWEMGAGRLRVPLRDLVDRPTVSRMADLVAAGHSFHTFSYDVPAGVERQALVRHADLVRTVEVVLPRKRLAERFDDLTQLRRDTDLEIYVSPLSTSARTAHGDAAQSRFTHFVRHGYDPADDIIDDVGGNDGVVFRLPFARHPVDDIAAAQRLASRHELRAMVHVALAGDDPAAEPADDLGTANRVAEALLAAWCTRDTLVFLDTFADVDRGYFPRRGLVDRRARPRLAGLVYRNLHAALRGIGVPMAGAGKVRVSTADLSGARVCVVTDPVAATLVLPNPVVLGAELKTVTDAASAVVDLATGTVRRDVDISAETFSTPVVLTAQLPVVQGRMTS